MVYPLLEGPFSYSLSFGYHGMPFILTTIEWFFNQAPSEKNKIIAAICVMAVYTLGVNLPYTLAVHEVYPHTNYRNYYTYFCLCFGVFAHFSFGVVFLHAKRRQLRAREIKLSRFLIEINETNI